MGKEKPIIVAIITNGSIFYAYSSCKVQLIEVNNDTIKILKRPTYHDRKELEKIVPLEYLDLLPEN